MSDDTGMVHLLMLKDLIDKLVANQIVTLIKGLGKGVGSHATQSHNLCRWPYCLVTVGLAQYSMFR